MKSLKNITTYLLALLIAGSLPFLSFAQQGEENIQYYRPYDRTGANTFEMPMETNVEFDGLKIEWGAAFRQQWQTLNHSNDPFFVDGVNENELEEIGPGFNTANANLYLDVQLADGVKVNVTTYFSSRHHPEAWVKGGYLQVDDLKMLNSPFIDKLMKNLRLKIGQYELNYGDQHFRRSDNAQGIYNPFVGNYIMDPFTTEIGGEVQYLHDSGFLAVLSIMSGELRGRIDNEANRDPSFSGKIGYDNRGDLLRLRLTGSFYHTNRSAFNTLYFGDRAGSHYHVMDFGDNDFSGRVNPGLTNQVTSFMINPFVKMGGLEFFGTYETTEGTGFDEAIQGEREWEQWAAEGIYRFLKDEQAYLGIRYNKLTGELPFSGTDVDVDRWNFSGGWFITDTVLLKAEYVVQDYEDFPANQIFAGADFEGLILEGVVAF